MKQSTQTNQKRNVQPGAFINATTTKHPPSRVSILRSTPVD